MLKVMGICTQFLRWHTERRHTKHLFNIYIYVEMQFFNDCLTKQLYVLKKYQA